MGQVEKYKTYDDLANGFSVSCPYNWEYQKNPRTAFIFIRPIEEQSQVFRENINLIINSSKNLSLKEYTGASKVQISSQLPGYKEVSTDYFEVKGIKYARVIYEHKTNNLPLKVAYYITLRGDKAYGITCSSTIKNFNKYYLIFEYVIQSFHFTK